MKNISGFTAKCREKGLKLTPQRLAIYKILSAKAQHPTINEVYGNIKKEHPSLSLNTVYKTLQLFIELGMASQFTTKEGVIRYEVKIQPHHHILCLKCRRIDDIFDSALNKLKLSPSLRRGFEVVKHEVVFYGYCSKCKTT